MAPSGKTGVLLLGRALSFLVRKSARRIGRIVGLFFPHGLWVPLPLLSSGRKMLLDLRDPLYALLMCLGLYERDTVWLLQRVLEPGMTFVDGGANFGFYTLLASSLVGETGRVVAVEAHPVNAQVLRRNVALNRLRNVEVVAAALAERRGAIQLHVSKDTTRHSIVYTPPSISEGSLEVDGFPLDDLVPRADVIKLDLEGAEPMVLRGMGRLLRDSKPSILLEFCPGDLEGAGVSPSRFMGELRERFDVFAIRGFRMVHHPDGVLSPGTLYVNLFLRPA